MRSCTSATNSFGSVIIIALDFRRSPVSRFFHSSHRPALVSTGDPLRAMKYHGCCPPERFSERFRGVKGHPFENGFDLTLRPERLAQPVKWRQPRRIFVNSMSDLFHKEIPTAFIDSVFDTMEQADWHIYQVLTKRSSLIVRYLRNRYGGKKAPPHIWVGVSIENAQNAVRLKH